MFVLCMCEFISNSKTLCMANAYCQSGWGGGGGGGREELGLNFVPNNCQPIFMGMGVGT